MEGSQDILNKIKSNRTYKKSFLIFPFSKTILKKYKITCVFCKKEYYI